MTAKDSLAPLRDELPLADLKALDALTPAEISRLAKLIGDARQQQRKQLREALNASLEHVPFLLRGAVRRVLFP